MKDLEPANWAKRTSSWLPDFGSERRSPIKNWCQICCYQSAPKRMIYSNMIILAISIPENAVTADSRHGRLWFVQLSTKGRRLHSVFLPWSVVSWNFTGFHTQTEWMSPPCPGRRVSNDWCIKNSPANLWKPFGSFSVVFGKSIDRSSARSAIPAYRTLPDR